MRDIPTKLVTLAFLALFVGAAFMGHGRAQKTGSNWKPAIPKTWDDEAVATLVVPLADPRYSPAHVSSDYYYRMPVRPIYKSYPIYAPGKEPPGYLDWLRQQEPEIVFDAARLKTEADWIRAGELVFDAPIAYDDSRFPILTGAALTDRAWYEKTGTPAARDGVMPYGRYVVRAKGKLEVGNLSCAMCHTRVMPDGSMIKGAQGNFPFDRAIAFFIRSQMARSQDPEAFRRFSHAVDRLLFAAPWARPDPLARIEQMSLEERAAMSEAIPPGVLARHGASIFFPVRVPDLIGVKERRYLDSTGLILHRGIGDLMRYAALNQDADQLARHGDFRPIEQIIPGGKLPDDPTTLGARLSRYSDEQLYALALYIYSLKPPPNPNKFNALARRGQKVFQSEGCAVCHTPPLYTNNKLTPAEGFKVPEWRREKYDILPMSVGTDPSLAMRTRRGTGYYKAPSLKGVWYGGPFEHNGSVATLEDWFDPRRLRDDYAPTGYKPYGVKTRAVKGHEFGLQLAPEDKKALIAFLKTL